VIMSYSFMQKNIIDEVNHLMPEYLSQFLDLNSSEKKLYHKTMAFKKVIMNAINNQSIDDILSTHFQGYSFQSAFSIDDMISTLAIQLLEDIRKLKKFNWMYQVYYYWGQYNRVHHNDNEYLEKITHAYIYAGICEKIKMLNEIKNLKKKSIRYEFFINQKSKDALLKAGLTQRWNENKLLTHNDVCFCP